MKHINPFPILCLLAIILYPLSAGANHQPSMIRGVMCDTVEQINMFLTYAQKNPTVDIRMVAKEINKQVKLEGSCEVVRVKLPAYFAGELKPYVLGTLQVTVKMYKVLFPGQRVFVLQFMYSIKNLSHKI